MAKDEDKVEEKLHTETINSATSFGSGEPTDGRKKWEWESKYPEKARKVINFEATVLVTLFFFSLLMLFLTWCGAIHQTLMLCCNPPEANTLKTYSYITFSGLLAGVIFSIKYLYHAVGRGTWHMDRQLWRFMSPLMSLGVAFIVGAMANSTWVDMAPSSAAGSVFLGFIAGYFSDSAIAKMYEVANVLFGTSSKPK